MSVPTRVLGNIHAQLRTLVGSAGNRKNETLVGPRFGVRNLDPKAGSFAIVSYDGPHFGVQNSDPKTGSSWMVFLGASALSKTHFCQQVRGFTACLAVSVSWLLQGDCRSQVRASANWGGPSQRDRFLCRFSAPVLGSSETASFVGWRRLGFFTMDC